MDKITAGCRKIITYEKNGMVTAWNTCIVMGLVQNNKRVLPSSQKHIIQRAAEASKNKTKFGPSPSE